MRRRCARASRATAAPASSPSRRPEASRGSARRSYAESSMPKAFICGCAGLELNAEEKGFLRASDPWGLILFRRNVASRDQLRQLTESFRDCVGRAGAPVLVDQEGGRVQRMGPPEWRAYPAPGVLEAKLTPARAESAARLVARLIAHDLREVGITV